MQYFATKSYAMYITLFHRFLLLLSLCTLLLIAISCGDDDEPDNETNEQNDTTQVEEPFINSIPALDTAKIWIATNWQLRSTGKEANLSTVANQTLMCFSELQYSYTFEGVMNNHNTYKLWEVGEGLLLELNEGAYGTTDYDLIHLSNSDMKLRERERQSSFVYYFEKTDLNCN